MAIKECIPLKEWANRFKSDVCGAIDCNSTARDFAVLEASRGHFCFDPCESHTEHVPELKDPAIYQ